MRRSRRVAAGIGLCLVLGGCGGDPDFGLGGPRTSTGPVSLDVRDAAAEARSAASQEATSFDVSLPPTAFEAACASPKPEEGREWSCTVRSADGRCEGTVEVVAPSSGAIATRRRALTCRP